MSDLKSPTLIHLKGWMFLIILLASLAILVIENPNIRSVALLLLIAWSSARFYYYLFYVIEEYIDPEYKFSGVVSAVRYFLSNKRNQ
jgi:hypothetical protein